MKNVRRLWIKLSRVKSSFIIHLKVTHFRWNHLHSYRINHIVCQSVALKRVKDCRYTVNWVTIKDRGATSSSATCFLYWLWVTSGRQQKRRQSAATPDLMPGRRVLWQQRSPPALLTYFHNFTIISAGDAAWHAGGTQARREERAADHQRTAIGDVSAVDIDEEEPLDRMKRSQPFSL